MRKLINSRKLLLGITTLVLLSNIANVTHNKVIAAAPNAVNLPPVISPIPDQSVSVGETLTLTISATDPENQPLTYNVGLPGGASFDAITHVFSWTPTASDVGNYSAGVTVYDGASYVSSQINIAVKAAAAATTSAESPSLSFSSLSDQSIAANRTLSFKVNTSREAVVMAANLPKGAKFDSKTQTFIWKTSSRNVGTSRVTFTARDGINKVTKTINIKVYRNSSLGSHD